MDARTIDAGTASFGELVPLLAGAPAPVTEAAAHLVELSGEQMLQAVDAALLARHVGPAAASVSAALRLALFQDDVAATVVGAARTVHDSAAAAFPDLAIRFAAQRAILDIDMLSASAVAEVLRQTSKNSREAASRLRLGGTLLGLQPPGARAYLYPAFQFDPLAAAIHPVVAEVNQVLGAAEDPWGVASWWISPHARLEPDQAPRDLITDPEQAQRLPVLARSTVAAA